MSTNVDLGRVRVSVIRMHKGYWGFGLSKTPSAVTLQFAVFTADIFWGYGR